MRILDRGRLNSDIPSMGLDTVRHKWSQMKSTSSVKIYNEKDFPAYLPKLNNLYDDLFSDGKGFRAKLVQSVSECIQVPSSTQLLLCQTIEFIHNASLLHDDLVDRSQLRRGKPAAWTKYTPEYAVLAGDYLLARVMVNLSHFGNIKLVQYTAEMISDLLEGEWLQDSVVGDFFVSLEQLDRIHNLKTASLFKWCLRAPFIAHENYDPQLHETLSEMGTLLGQLFQRSDDLLDYDVRNHERKAILGDLKSGYLNSFAAFIVRGKDKSQVDQMIKSDTLEQFYNSVGGPDRFQTYVQDFDQTNSQLIELYEHHCQRLKTMLNPSSAEALLLRLKPLTQILYWREKPK